MSGRFLLRPLLASLGVATVFVGGSLVFVATALQPLDSGVLLRAGALADADHRGASPFSPLAVGDSLTFEFVGSDGRAQRYDLTVTEGIADATADIERVDPSNALPTFGYLYARSRLRVEYLGSPQPGDLGELKFVLVPEGADANRPGDKHALTTHAHYCGVLADPLDLQATVYGEAVVEGELCWTIRSSDLGHLLLRVESPAGERRWLALA